jgi:hypothetical protein
VLHDGDDAGALRVLRSCRAAMRPDWLLHGRERSASDFAALLDAAGLQLTADVPTGAGVHVLQARPHWQDDIDAGRAERLSTDERAEPVRLRRENRVQAMEIVVLERAGAYVAREAFPGPADPPAGPRTRR